MSYFNYLRGYIVLWGNLVVKNMLNQERDVNSITSTKCLSSVFCKSWGKKGLWIWALGPRELISQKVPELLEEVAPSLETCKVKLDRALSWSSWRRSLQGGWTRWPLKVPSSPNYSVILWPCNNADMHLRLSMSSQMWNICLQATVVPAEKVALYLIDKW